LLPTFSPHPSSPPPHLHSFPTRRSSDLGHIIARAFSRIRRRHQHTKRKQNENCRLGRWHAARGWRQPHRLRLRRKRRRLLRQRTDRKSTRLNSSHLVISYAVFCLKKKKK